MGDVSSLTARISEAFGSSDRPPAMSLRGGAAIDLYHSPPPFDPVLDRPTETYIERHCAGLIYLDAQSWRFYLPLCLTLALRRAARPGDAVVEATLWTLRPPDREPPRLGALSPQQEAAVVAALEYLAFAPESAHQDFAMQVLEEYWIPGALYRTP